MSEKNADFCSEQMRWRLACRRRTARSRLAPADGDPGDVQLVVESQTQAELGGVVLNVARVVDVQLGAAERPALEPTGSLQRFGGLRGDGLVRLRAAMLYIRADRRLVVEQLLRAVLELFVVAEEVRVGQVKGLRAKAVLAAAQVEIGEEEGVKHRLAELEVGDLGVPGRLGAALHA